jgi:uncharacterized membrane protein YjgN (DUF898 family)
VLAVDFTATTGEYFRLWIVNVALTIVTLGIYSAWAKVRKRRYLYGHTRVAGEGFEYLARPLPILLGRLIALALIGAIVAADVLVPALAASRLLRQSLYVVILAIAGPWIIVRSLRFNARNTAYRNIRFRFDAGYRDCLRVVVAYGWLGLLGIFYPFFKRRLVRFAIENHCYGATRFELPVDFAKPFVRAYYVAYGLFAMFMIAAAIVLMIVLAIVSVAVRLAKPQMFAVGFLLWLPVYAIAIGTTFAYVRAKTVNAVWNNVRVGPVRFSSSLRARDVIWLYFSNALAVVATMGFATPWAVIRTHRYRASKTTMIASAPLDGFVQAEAEHVGAAGQEIGDFLDLDVSL